MRLEVVAPPAAGPVRVQAAPSQPHKDTFIRSPYAPSEAPPSMPSAPPPMADVAPPPEDEATRLTSTQKWIIIGALGALVLGGAVGAGIYIWGPGATDTTISQPAEVPGANDRAVLRALDGQGMLFHDGRSIDAYSALRHLERGEPIELGVSRMGNRSIFYAPPGVAADQVQTQNDAKPPRPTLITVRSFRDLQRANAAERLTDVDTTALLTAEEKELLQLLTPLEGGTATARTLPRQAPQGQAFTYMPSHPSPSLLRYGHGGYDPGDRLTAYQAMELIMSGQRVAVRTPGGLDQTVRTLQHLRALTRLEMSTQTVATTTPEQATIDSILRQLGSAKRMTALESFEDIRSGQELSAYQGLVMLHAGRAVSVQVDGPLRTTIRTTADLLEFNAEEGATSVDTSNRLTPRQQQTVRELRAFEGRGSTTAGLFTTEWRPLRGPRRLAVRDARAMLERGEAIRVRTARGHEHTIRNLDELSALYQLVGAEAGPPARGAAPGGAGPTTR